MATSNEYRAIPQDDSFRAPVGQRSYQNQPPMYTRYNTQPAPSVIIRRNRPNNYLFQAILVTLFCCCPFGTIGLCYSVESSQRFDGGDVEGAESSANMAQKWSIAGLVCGILAIIPAAVILVWFTVLRANSSYDPYGQE
ncbi:proline rich transmembrane protein 1B-like isoform X1 [Antedon mediterranea]|uniref:proline rich transmembrane protein 1B-like isoform X1 n=1 Tax=Antedon mediterranea TaxID=105859 RepID=UPI003AF965FC